MKVDSTLIVISFKISKSYDELNNPKIWKFQETETDEIYLFLHDKPTSEQCRLKDTTTKW